MMERKSFVFYKDWRDAIKDLPDDVRLELYDSIMEYAFTGKVEGLKPMVSIAFNFIKPSIDRDAEKYMSVSERNKTNGAKGGRPKSKTQENPNNPNATSETQENPNNLDNDNVNDNDYNSLSNTHEVFPPPDVFDKSLDELHAIMLKSEIWREDVIRRAFRTGYSGFSINDFERFLELYILKLRSEGKKSKSECDAKEHFANWLMIELKKQEDDKRRAKPFSPTTTSPTGKVVCGEVKATTDKQFSGTTPKDYSARF